VWLTVCVCVNWRVIVRRGVAGNVLACAVGTTPFVTLFNERREISSFQKKIYM
jgi:hypothetical protein